MSVSEVLKGTWINQQGSKMQLLTDGYNLKGSYITTVGNVEQEKFNLIGQYYPVNGSNDEATLGFVVNWRQSDKDKEQSVTTWGAQLIHDENNEYIIEASWVIKNHTTYNDVWKSTRTNVDVFRKQK